MTYKVDFDSPEIKKLLTMSADIVEHCEEFDIPKDCVVNGVAIDAEKVCSSAYGKGVNEGIKREQKRIALMLGLDI